MGRGEKYTDRWHQKEEFRPWPCSGYVKGNKNGESKNTQIEGNQKKVLSRGQKTIKRGKRKEVPFRPDGDSDGMEWDDLFLFGMG